MKEYGESQWFPDMLGAGVGGGRVEKGEDEEEEALTDGGSQIDWEKQGLALSRFYFAGSGLASEPHQTRVIIPCQLAREEGGFLWGVSLLSDNYQHNEKATFLLLSMHAVNEGTFGFIGLILKVLKKPLFCFLF